MQRRRKSVDTRVAELEAKKTQYQAKIEGYKVKMSELDAKIKELEDAQKQKELEKLLTVIKDSGKTPEEVISALSAK